MSGLWQAPARSAEARAIYESAEADRAANPEKYRLEVEPLAAAALAKARDASDDDGDWREGFGVYVNAAREEGRLNALGIRNMAAAAIGRVQSRFALARALASKPEVAQRKVERPIFIIGGWRTGTTLMQRLLGALPALRALYPAELSVPGRFAGLTGAEREALLDAGEGAHHRLHTLNPTMQAVHPSGGRLAEECVLAMGTDMRNWGFTSTLRCPSYANWLLGQDMTGSYRRYRDILKLLEMPDGRRFVLKAPAHTAELERLLTVFPDACVMHLHRDVVETVTSGASLFAVFRSTYSDAVDAADVGRYQLDMTQRWFERAMAARDAHRQADVLDVSFPELVADPVAMAEKICRRFDIGWGDGAREAAVTQLAALKTQHGAHRYTPEEFGLAPEEIRARLSGYRARFGVS
ncbi:MAG: sulfotransferase [Alphaproteobacteria bacterium]|nr:sulfotransferase [Alphaproteobacteria bacterium]